MILTIGLIAFSLLQDIQYGFSTPQHEIPPDWGESLTWLEQTPPRQELIILNRMKHADFPTLRNHTGLWLSGMLVTGSRFLHTEFPSPILFRTTSRGSSGAAAYFLSQNESQADEILHSLGGKYVITNSDMAIDTFTNLVPWPSGSVDISPYIKWFMVRDANNPSLAKGPPVR